MVVKVEEIREGATYAGRPYGPQSVRREARAAMWLRAGGDWDVAAATTWAERNDYQVMTFPTTELDPIGKAKAQALGAALAAVQVGAVDGR